MNDLEFREQYKRLRETHPMKFEPTEKLNTIWRFVQDMEVAWFKSLVDRIVMSSRGDLDIGEAVAAERRHRKSKEFADSVCAATNAWQGVTEKGLDNVLGKYGAGSLADAVLKSRRGEF